MDGREEIRCHGKLQAEIDVRGRKLYLWCRYHRQSEQIDLQPYIDRMLAQDEDKEQDEDQMPVRLLRVM